jgi:hypothetical protein
MITRQHQHSDDHVAATHFSSLVLSSCCRTDANLCRSSASWPFRCDSCKGRSVEKRIEVLTDDGTTAAAAVRKMAQLYLALVRLLGCRDRLVFDVGDLLHLQAQLLNFCRTSA